ncbi:unnamed protein product, partial [Plutella xylostella]
AEATIKPIVHSPGVFFEPQLPIHFYNDYWKVVTHVDVFSITPYLLNVESNINKTFNLCSRVQNVSELFVADLSDIINPAKVLLESNFIKSQSISHLISDQSSSRSKRALEFGGEILKFFFGTLDADDARKYDDAIAACQSNEQNLFSLMKENIHIVKSSINNFNETIFKLNVNEQKLNGRLSMMQYILSNISRNNNDLINIARLQGFNNLIESSLLTISNMLDNILNSVLFAKANILHPSILSPSKLLIELEKRSNHIKRNLDFPITLNINNIHTIIDVSKLTSYFYNNKLVFVLQIPLIAPTKFNLYKNIPLPTPHGQSEPLTFALISPSKNYLAITDDRLSYCLLDNMYECKLINNEYSICPQCSIFSSLSNPSCETRLLTEVTVTLPNECNSRLLYGTIDIWQPLNNNKWIYVQSKPNKLITKCGNFAKEYSLFGTGVLTLTEDCIAYCKTIQLIPTTMFTISINSDLHLDFDITQDDCCKRDLFNNTIPYLSPVSLTSIDLESLRHASHKLDNLETELNKAQKQSHIIKYGSYYTSTTYVLTILFILFCVYKCCRYLTRKQTSNRCINVFRCNNRKLTNSKISKSIELSEVSIDDKKSVKSLPPSVKHLSNRNLSNY